MYVAEGYLLAHAFIPQQEVKDSTVEIVIYEGKITLTLSYIEKPEQPDAFQLKEDDF